MKKTAILCLAAMIICSMSISGCGSSDSNAGTQSAPADTEISEPSEANAGLSFIMISELTGSDKRSSLDKLKISGEYFVCFIEEGAPEKVVIPAEYEGLPVKAVFGRENGGSGVKELTIEKGVVLIDGLFKDENISLNTVILPETTEYIKNSFRRCNALKSAAIKGDPKYIEDSFNDNSVDTVSIGGLSGEVRESFCELDSLTELTVGDVKNAQLIDSFEKCSAIEKLVFKGTFELDNSINEDEEYVNSYLFTGSETLEEVVLEGEVIRLPESFCSDCNALKTLTFKKKVGLIPYMAFSDCKALSTIAFEDKVDTIDKHTFGSNNVKELVFEHEVGKIDEYSFQSCNNLTSVTFKESVGELNNCFALSKKLDSVTFENSVEDVVSAFNKCPVLKSVTFNGSVEKIYGAFIDCPELEKVTFGSTLGTITSAAFSKSDKVELVNLPEGTEFGSDELSQRFDPEQQKFRGYYDKVNAWTTPVLKEWVKANAAGRSFDGSKQISISEAVNYAGVLNGPIVYNYRCTDCPFDEYGVEAAQNSEFFVTSIKDVKKSDPDTVYTDEKALKVSNGEAPLVIGVAESMGYIPVEYIDENNSDHTETVYYEMMRVSLWNADTGELIAWYQHRDGEAPLRFTTSDRSDYLYHENIGTDHSFYFFEGGFRYPEAMLFDTIYPDSE